MNTQKEHQYLAEPLGSDQMTTDQPGGVASWQQLASASSTPNFPPAGEPADCRQATPKTHTQLMTNNYCK